MESVNAVIVLDAVDAGEQQFLAIRLKVSVIVDKEEDAVQRRDDRFGAFTAASWHDHNSVGRVDVVPLIEHGFLVGLGVAVRIFQNDDSVALLAIFQHIGVSESTIVNCFADPDSTHVIDIDRGGIGHHWLGREQVGRQFGMNVELHDGHRRIIAFNLRSCCGCRTGARWIDDQRVVLALISARV